jgi:nucleotide-binding universal stress UspA family protein
MYKILLLPIDITQEASWHQALPVAIEQARANSASLHIVVVAPEPPPQLPFLPVDYGSKMVSHAKQILETILKEHTPDDIQCHQHVRQGSIYKEILTLAREVNADLIVMASHQPGIEDYLLGPNAARVVRHASCSVLVVRG